MARSRCRAARETPDSRGPERAAVDGDAAGGAAGRDAAGVAAGRDAAGVAAGRDAAGGDPVDPADRGSAPVVGVVLLVALAVLLAGVVGAGVLAVAPPEPPDRAGFGLSVDADTGRVALVHRAGDPIDVRTLDVRILVGGEPLAHQPPVPFFAAEGFRAGPTGPFNAAADGQWDPGETASLRIAGTNAPALAPGARVVVELYVGDRRIARLETTA